MQSRARMKKSLLSWCSSRRRAHCSNVTDMDVRSLALLQLVNLMPFNLRQTWREASRCWYSVRNSPENWIDALLCFQVVIGDSVTILHATLGIVQENVGGWDCSAALHPYMYLELLNIKLQSRSCSSMFYRYSPHHSDPRVSAHLRANG